MLQLLKKLQVERGLTYMFITHDLSVVEYISDRIVVMYLGRVVEMADTEELFEHTLHPYTKALLSAIPIADIDKRRKRIPLQGDVPSPVHLPPKVPGVYGKMQDRDTPSHHYHAGREGTYGMLPPRQRAGSCKERGSNNRRQS